MFPVYFFSETNSFVTLESYHTIKDLKANIMKKLQFNPQRIPYYNLYEICHKKDILEERFLDDNDKVVDIIAVWDKENQEFSKRKETIEFKMYLKLQLFNNYAETDIDTITMIYFQTNYEIIHGRFNLNEELAITLAALQLMVNYGANSEFAYQNLQSEIEKYIPKNILQNNPSITWLQKIMESFSATKTLSKLGSKITYLEKLKESLIFQSHQFIVKVITYCNIVFGKIERK